MGVFISKRGLKMENKKSKTEVKEVNHDPINHPKHYTFGKFQVIDVLEDWFPYNPALWQVGKYIARAAWKGEYLEDLKKAQFYLERAIEKAETIADSLGDF